MAITNYDGIILSRAAGKADDPLIQKLGTVVGVAGNWYSYMKFPGTPTSVVAYGNASAGGSRLTATDAGAIPVKAATSGDSKYLLTVGVGSLSAAEMGAIGLVEVLWAGGQVQMGSSSTVTVNNTTVLNSTAWKTHEIGVMISTILTTASTMVINYVDGGGTATSINCVIATAGGQGRLMPNLRMGVGCPNGVKQITSVQCQTAQTAGAVDLFIFKPLAIVPTIAANAWVERDMTAQIDGILKLDIDTTSGEGPFLSIVGLNSGSTVRGPMVQLRMCAG
jgi:hypothetical protein